MCETCLSSRWLNKLVLYSIQERCRKDYLDKESSLKERLNEQVNKNEELRATLAESEGVAQQNKDIIEQLKVELKNVVKEREGAFALLQC